MRFPKLLNMYHPVLSVRVWMKLNNNYNTGKYETMIHIQCKTITKGYSELVDRLLDIPLSGLPLGPLLEHHYFSKKNLAYEFRGGNWLKARLSSDCWDNLSRIYFSKNTGFQKTDQGEPSVIIKLFLKRNSLNQLAVKLCNKNFWNLSCMFS